MTDNTKLIRELRMLVSGHTQFSLQVNVRVELLKRIDRAADALESADLRITELEGRLCDQCGEAFSEHSCTPIPSCIHLTDDTASAVRDRLVDRITELEAAVDRFHKIAEKAADEGNMVADERDGLAAVITDLVDTVDGYGCTICNDPESLVASALDRARAADTDAVLREHDAKLLESEAERLERTGGPQDRDCAEHLRRRAAAIREARS